MKRTDIEWKHEYAFIGAGSMASAIITGLIDKNVCSPGNIIIHRRDKTKNAPFIRMGVDICEDYTDTFSSSRFIFLCVKPGQAKGALEELAASGADYGSSVFISICAAVSCDMICGWLGKEVSVIRVMPSTPMTVGKGTAAISQNGMVTKKDFEYVCRALSRIAEISIIPEEMQNTVVSVNGSSPAYFYLFVKAMLDSAEEQGIERSAALPLILRTMEGSAEMIRCSGKPIEQLIKDVSSPNGTTLAALEEMRKGNLEETVRQAMKACTDRADEISDELRNN